MEAKLSASTLPKEGITKAESQQARNILHNPELMRVIVEKIVKSGKIVTHFCFCHNGLWLTVQRSVV